jgi:exodeoxyribonuclease V alpha subunit
MSTEERLLQQGWLADGLARRLEASALRQGAQPPSARAAGEAARQLCRAIAEGHVCLGLDELEAFEGGPGSASQWRSLLLASGVVAAAQPATQPATRPLVLDDEGRLYLARYHAYEQRLARRLLQASRHPVTPDEQAVSRLQARLVELFRPGGQPTPAPDWQMLAAALASRSRLTVISGGPGTGKTTTVVALLACLLAEDPACRIALAAPTGKAAARMLEALRERGARLPAAWREALPRRASTVHRLLGSRADGSFTHHAQHPLALDVLVVDEASMLDLSVATQLLEAVPPHARIVLLGDRHQLAAVEAGAVFAEISADPTLSDPCRRELAALTGTPEARIAPPPPILPSPLRDAVV